MDGVVTAVEDSIAVAFMSVGKFGDSFMSENASQSTPLIDSLVGLGPRPMRPDVFGFFFKNHDRVDGFVQYHRFLQMHSILALSDVGLFFSNRYLAPLKMPLWTLEAFRYSLFRTLSMTRLNWTTT